MGLMFEFEHANTADYLTVHAHDQPPRVTGFEMPDFPRGARISRSCNFGAPIGQSQQLMHTVDLLRGAALAKSLSGGPRQSN